MRRGGAPAADLIIAGGGLAGGLVALAVRARHPDAAITLIEPDARIGGNHIWSFFDSDIDPAHRWLIDPLIAHHWADYDVRFPERRRTLPTGYNSILSEDFDTAVRAAIAPDAILSVPAVNVGATTVQLADQTSLSARTVIDARGRQDWSDLSCGWQKFVGRVYHLATPHGLTRPTIMDATVEQIDGYRFVYVLPFSADSVFVEDTYYSDSAAIDVPALESRLDAYVTARGWAVTAVSRQEVGVLPVVQGGAFDAFLTSARDMPDAILVGGRAGLFQPVTSYSLPDAVRVAVAVADAWPCDAATLGQIIADHSQNRWRAGRFGRLLNRMLFDAAQPDQRYRVLQHFYRLPVRLIERFYAGTTGTRDAMRILTGRPPVPISAAIRAMLRDL